MLDREFPKIYCRFEGKKMIDGVHREYWIQDATDDLFPEILHNLTNNFIGDEPTTKYLNCKEDTKSMEEFRHIWIKMLEERFSIVCLTKDKFNNKKLAGFNVLTEAKAGDEEDYQVQGKTITTLFKIFEYTEKQRNFYKEFNLKTCMKAMGLYVLLDFRGDGVGERILDARELLCRNIGFTATITAFSSIASQKIATKVGFLDFYKVKYTKLAEIDPSMQITGIEEHTEYIKYMYKLYN